MDVFLGWLPWWDEAYQFHGSVNSGEARGQWFKLEVLMALKLMYSQWNGGYSTHTKATPKYLTDIKKLAI